MDSQKQISIVIPLYNEAGNLEKLYSDLKDVLAKISCSCNYEIIFVDDGSTDGSTEMVLRFAANDRAVKVIEFSRNFGKELAITAGVNNCEGDACIIMDADLQHPIGLIPEFVKKWEAGAEVVVGVREKNKNEGLTKKIGSILFYKIIGMISETEMVPRSTDYRLLDRKVIKEFNRFTEKNRITRGLIAWLGFKKDYIYFAANARYSGRASYGFFKLIKLALSAFVTHSLFPLKLAGYVGVFITIFSAITGIFIFTDKYILNNLWNLNFTGTALLAVLIIFFVGIILCCLGLIALYIANIHEEVSHRPLYIVRRRENFDN
ncbi:MAG: glycosyltransferase family 2 protein [Patescibacteria group bacterium]|jgi:dolichol-phosphate mannosyltransferase